MHDQLEIIELQIYSVDESQSTRQVHMFYSTVVQFSYDYDCSQHVCSIKP
jgi:hypothetical protein